MTISPTVRLAKQGNAQAIAQLLNQQLQPRGITAQAWLEGRCLHVSLEASCVAPPQRPVVGYLRHSLERLGAKAIGEVQIVARQRGRGASAWEVRLPLVPMPAQRALLRRRRSGFRRCLRIWAHWQAIALGVSFVFLLALVGLAGALLWVVHDLGGELPEVSPAVGTIAIATLFFWGLILGDAQTEVLHQRLRRAGLWKWATALGFPLGLALGLWLRFYADGTVLRWVGLLPFSMDASVFLGVVMPVVAGGAGFGVLGGLQWLAIRRAIRHSGRWLVVSPIAGAASAVLGALGGRWGAAMLLGYWRLADMLLLEMVLHGAIAALLIWFSYQGMTGVAMAGMLHGRPKTRLKRSVGFPGRIARRPAAFGP